MCSTSDYSFLFSLDEVGKGLVQHPEIHWQSIVDNRSRTIRGEFEETNELKVSDNDSEGTTGMVQASRTAVIGCEIFLKPFY